MDESSFTALAPRRGTRPVLAPWEEIGVSSISGGAFNWSSLWSGLKSFGSTLKSYGSKAWNSSTGQALRDKLRDTKVQEKIVDAANAGIHGAIDIARQAIDKEIEKRLDRPPVDPTGEAETTAQKRPREEEEEIIARVEGPPSYDEIYPNKATAPAVPLAPTTRPAAPMATPVASKPKSSTAPAAVIRKPASSAARSRSNWQSTLNSIVGLGVNSCKRRRCF